MHRRTLQAVVVFVVCVVFSEAAGSTSLSAAEADSNGDADIAKLSANGASDSTIWLKISVPLKPLLDLAEQLPGSCTYGMRPEAAQNNKLDKEVDRKEIFDAFSSPPGHINFTNFNFFDRHPDVYNKDDDMGFRYYAKRSPFFVANDPTRQNLILSTDIDFKVAIARRAPIWIFGSLGTDDRWPAKIRLTLKSPLKSSSDYRLSMESSIDSMALSDLRITTAFGITLQQSHEVAGKIQGQLGPLAKALDRQVSEISFRHVIEDAWSRLSHPIDLGEEVYANVTPRQLVASPVEVNGDSLTMLCGLVASAQLTDNPTPSQPTPLPPLEATSGGDKPFALNARIAITANHLNRLAKSLQGRTFVFGTAEMTLSGVDVALAENRVRVNLSKAKIEQGGNTFVFDAIVTTSPSIETEGGRSVFVPSALVEECEWLGNPIKAWIAKQVNLDTKKLLQNELSKFLRIEITKEVKTIIPEQKTLASGVTLHLSNTAVSLGPVRTSDDNKTLYAELRGTGHAELTLDNQAIAFASIPETRRLDPVGGGGGNPFAIEASWPASITGIEISAQAKEAIQGIGIVKFSLDSATVGVMDDRIEKVCLQKDEYIKGLEVKENGLIVEMVVVTNQRRTRPYGKGDPTRPWRLLYAPEGFEVVGFHGRSGLRLDNIGLIVRKRNG